MEHYIINGGNRLEGELTVQTSKNAILPLLAGALLTEEEVIIHKCPHITDVKNMLGILQTLGCSYRMEEKDLILSPKGANGFMIPETLGKELRSSIFLLGSILGRFKRATVSYPGGCDIGLRPIDLHVKGLKCLGVKIEEQGGMISCDGSNMRGGPVHLDFPSVGATENIMLAAATTRGETVIHNAAKEPEIVDLQNFLNSMGAKIVGAGCSIIHIEGVERLLETEYTPIPDRIVAGTYLLATVMCGGKLELRGCNFEHIYSLIAKLRESACKIKYNNDKIYIEQSGKFYSSSLVETSPYPGFPTDLQAQYLAYASVAEGTSIVVENIFETRFKHAGELIRMGARITVRDRMAVVCGVPKLHGAEVTAHDLRGGAALVLAGLKAEGQTVVRDTFHIDRGYENMEGVLRSLGADIIRQ